MIGANDSLILDIIPLLPGFLILAVLILGITILKTNGAKFNKFFYNFCFFLLSLGLVVSLLFQLLVIKEILHSRMKISMEEKKLSTVDVPKIFTNKGTIEDYKYKYFLKEDHKAFAYSLDGPYGYCTNESTADDAKRCALKYCESYQEKKFASCKIISVDGN